MSALSKAAIALFSMLISASAIAVDAEAIIDDCSLSTLEKRTLQWAFAFPVALSRAPDELTVENVERLQTANIELIDEIYDFTESYKAASVIINKRCRQHIGVLSTLRERYVVAWKIYRELEYIERLLIGSREYNDSVSGLEWNIQMLKRAKGEL